MARNRAKRGKGKKLPAQRARGRDSSYTLNFTASNAANAVIFLVILLVMSIAVSVIAAFLYYYNIATNIEATGSAALEISMLLSVLIYLRLRRGFGWTEVKRQLRITRDRLTLRNVWLGVLIFLVMLVITLLINLFSSTTGVNIDTNTAALLATQPLWFYAFTVFVSPVCEEVLFRAFMAPRLGILVSSVIFGLLHAGYNSTFGIDMIAAFVFGVIAAYALRKTDSLYPSIIGHVLVNALAVVAFLGLF